MKQTKKLSDNFTRFNNIYRFSTINQCPNIQFALEQVLRWAINRLIDEVEREEVGCKLTSNFDTRIKKYCAVDKWAMYYG